MRVCDVEECGRPHYGHGYCNAHLQRLKTGRDLATPIQDRRPGPDICRAGHDKSIVGRKVGGACMECSRIRDSHRKRERQTGWTEEEYRHAHNEQNGVCLMCGRPEEAPGGLRADHCHMTARKRGLLCIRCNGQVEPAITRYVTDPDFRARWDRYLTPGDS